VAAGNKHLKIIGETIRKYRERANLTQERLAEKADLHPVYIGEVERGEEAPSIAALLRISKVLKVRLRDLVRHV
jgi:transcriptional regulator with XRE-family HTH domain